MSGHGLGCQLSSLCTIINSVYLVSIGGSALRLSALWFIALRLDPCG
jgi:hypothetical protein